jgi:hypothetical protein
VSHGFESRYPWRMAELTGAHERKLDARSLHGVLGELHGTKMPGPAPLRRHALRPHTALVEAIEQRLRAPEPVSARGMLAVRDLLTSPGSCLYSPVDDVEACLRDVLENLEVH